MHDLLVGTSNPAKLQMLRDALAPLDIRVQSARDLGIALHVEEDGRTARDNARKKALAYALAAGRRALSIDNALYLDGLADAEQPGVDTRQLPGVAGRASDEQLLDYYARRVARLGGRVTGRWEFAICLADPRGQCAELSIFMPRTFVSRPSATLLAGYPLESIQIDPASGRYFSEMTAEEQAAFWQQAIGGELRAFLRRAGVGG